jgi:hypothetical protein
MNRLTVIPWLLWAVIAAFAIAFIFHAGRASAAPTFGVQDGKITITLFDEPCELKDQVSNLPMKATWVEDGKTYKGCWAARPDVEAIIAFFDDKTIALIPFGALKRLTHA